MRIVRFEQFFKREEQGIKRFTFVFIVILVAVTSFAQQELNIVKENGLIGTVTNGEVSEIDAGQPTLYILFTETKKRTEPVNGIYRLGYAIVEETTTYFYDVNGNQNIIKKKLTPKAIIPDYSIIAFQVTNVEKFWVTYSDNYVEAVIVVHGIVVAPGGVVISSGTFSGVAKFK